jgi:DNA repair ATPase RecN
MIVLFLLSLFRFFDTEPDNRIPVTDFSSFETCLNRKNNTVQYIRAIDNNYKDPQQVTERYLENAIDAVLAGKSRIRIKRRQLDARSRQNNHRLSGIEAQYDSTVSGIKPYRCKVQEELSVS